MIELEPAVIAAADHLEELNHHVHKHPKVEIIIDDARNYLMVTRQRYDVMISEPSYLWSRGIANLYTHEFYQQVKSRLAPDGHFVQWIQAYQMDPRDLSTVLRTLGATFNHISLWWGGGTDLVLLARSVPGRLTLHTLETEYTHNANLRFELANVLSINEPAGLLGYFLLDDPALRTMMTHGDINTDDRNVLEYRVPFNMAKKTSQVNHAEIRSRRQHVLPPFLQLPNPSAAALAGAETQVASGMLTHTLGASLVGKALRNTPASTRTMLLRARIAEHRGQYLTAIYNLQRAEKNAPQNATIPFQLGQLYWRQGESKMARKAFEKCLNLAPQHLEALRALARLELRAGNLELGLDLQQRVLATQHDVSSTTLYNDLANLGNIYMATGQTQNALEALNNSLALEPLGYVARRNLAEYHTRSGDIEKAIDAYEFLIQYYPAQEPKLYLALSELYIRVGRETASRQVLRKAKRIFPANAQVQWRF